MTRKMTRREWLTGGGCAALSGCAGRAPGVTPSPVSIVRAEGYDQRLYGIVRRILDEHKVDVRGRSVLLKPNLVEFDPLSPINTHPLVVHAAAEAFRALGAASVRIGEGPGHRRNTLDLADAAGYFATIPHFEEQFVDLNLDDVARIVPSRQLSGVRKWYLPKTALGADLLVSMPKMKTHHWVGVTLSMKNLFGVVPSAVYGWPKNVLHWAGIDECIADLHSFFPRQFSIVDGIVGMEGNGPIQGVTKPVGALVAGSDRVAVDATCCRIMKVDPFKVNYLRLASAAESHISELGMLQIGERVDAVATAFALIPEFRGLRLENA